MSYADFLKACDEIDESSEGDFVGPRSEDVITRAEQVIGYTFPPTYREFLLRYGCGDIHGQEFYGVIHGDFENSAIPDAVWYTLALRREGGLPHHFLIVHEIGDGSLSCLDFSQRRNDGECPIVIWEPMSEPGDRPDIEAEDFGQFLLTKLNEV